MGSLKIKLFFLENFPEVRARRDTVNERKWRWEDRKALSHKSDSSWQIRYFWRCWSATVNETAPSTHPRIELANMLTTLTKQGLIYEIRKAELEGANLANLVSCPAKVTEPRTLGQLRLPLAISTKESTTVGYGKSWNISRIGPGGSEDDLGRHNKAVREPHNEKQR